MPFRVVGGPRGAEGAGVPPLERGLLIRRGPSANRADRHQPFNLRVPGGVESIATGGAVYDVAFLQIFQADAVRGCGEVPSESRGRRVLPRPMHGDGVSQAPGGPPSAVALGLDGSMAALVPAPGSSGGRAGAVPRSGSA